MSAEFSCYIPNPLDLDKLLLEFSRLCKAANIVLEKAPVSVSRFEPVVEMPMPSKLDSKSDTTDHIYLRLQPDTEVFIMITSFSEEDTEDSLTTFSFPQRNPTSFLFALLISAAAAEQNKTTFRDESLFLELGADISQEQILKIVSQDTPTPFAEAARLVGRKLRVGFARS